MENEFKFYLDYKENGKTNCKEYGCEENGCCRCYIIESIEIDFNGIIKKIRNKILTDISNNKLQSERNLKIENILNNTNKKKTLELLNYGIERILTINKIYIPKNWDINFDRGYYGYEVSSIKLKNNIFQKIENEIISFISNPDISKKIEFLLLLEYGYILDKIKNLKYLIEYIDIDKIIFTQKHHYESIKNLDYLKYSKEDDIMGVVLEESNNYLIIDGYHRIKYCKKINLNKIKIIKIS